MFSITLNLDAKARTGLNALDWARARQLPDTTFITPIGSNVTRPVPVSEGFARSYFPRSERNICCLVQDDACAAGDLVLHEAWHDGHYVSWNPEISDERIRELWIAAIQTKANSD